MVQEFDLVLVNGKVFTQNKLVQANLGILNGKITEISKQSLQGYEVLDCKNNLVLPGLIDVHVHFRTPGQEHKEDWKTGSMAALAGGVTSVMDMPNNDPSTVSEKLLNEKRKLVSKKSLINYGFHFGLTSGNFNEFAKAKNVVSGKLYAGSTTGNLLVAEISVQEKIFQTAKQSNKLVFVHVENEQEIKKNIEKFKNEANSVELHSKIRTVKAEVLEIKYLLNIQKKFQNKLHFCHISSQAGIELIQQVKKTNLLVSCEVAPHHLFLSQLDYKKLGNFAKVNPSLKSKQDCASLWQALNSGAVDVIATDHAPHTIEEKSQDYWNAPSGVPGLETTLALLLTEFHKKNIALERIIQVCSQNPAKLLNLKNKGSIEKGKDADLIVVTASQEWAVKNDELFTKCKWSPFDGWKLKGKVLHTVVNGNLMFSEDQVIGKSLGKELILK
ncbi:MAG: dihydroorotase [Candidatus Diapherotrites archaeon]|nr:dihydroorotase [Candidatus Diapherotrites archaeon]